MQILLDTLTDHPEELFAAVDVIRRAAQRRADEGVPEGTTKASDVVNITIGSIIPAGNVVPIRSENELRSMFGDTIPAGTFGKAPLPADAIAIDVPDSFTAPAATPAACVTGVPAAPVLTIVPSTALPVTTIAAASPIVAPPVNVPSASTLTPAEGVSTAPAAPTAAVPAAGTSTMSTPNLATGAAPASAAVEEDADGYVWDKRIHSSNHKKYPDGRWMKRRNVDDETLARVKAELRAAEVPHNGDAWVAGAVDDPAVNAKVDAAMLAATSPVVPPPPPAPPAPPAPPVTPATAATLNFTPAQVAALGVHAAPTAQPASTIAVVPAAPVAAGPSGAIVPPAPVISPASVPAAPSAPPAANGITPAQSATTSLSSFKELMAQVVTPAMQAKKITPTEISSLCKSIGLPNGLPDLLPDTQPPRVELARVADAVRRHIGAA